ncbi:MAG: hypothetical protein ACJAYK_001809 [Crocinitomicaceae bacterium]|jgi:hypothetical protein
MFEMKMESSAIDILQWKSSPLVYGCTFGEIPVFSLKLNGVKTSPNIFEVAPQNPEPAPSPKKQISHAYSLPCSDDLIENVVIRDGYIHHIYSVYRHYFVDTSGDFSEYMTRFKGKTLNSLKRKIKKIENSNTEKSYFREFKNTNDVEEFLLIAKDISEKSYQEKLLGRSLPTDKTFKDKLFSMADKNLFRGYILYAEDTPIAYNLCPIYGQGIMLYDYTGYDPEYSRYSAGTVLQYKIIEDCFNDSIINTYDLCTGEGKHKEFFATGFKTCCDAFYFPASAFYISSVYLKCIIEYVARRIISSLDNLGVKARIKKFIRRFK